MHGSHVTRCFTFALLCLVASGSFTLLSKAEAEEPATAAEQRDQASAKKTEPIPPALKEYQGREIAQTMHYLGAPWLVRESRQREEDCAMLLEALHVKPGQAICDLGCGNGLYTLQLAKLVGDQGKVFAVDIHPAARIGKGLMFDHATGIVIGETAVVEDMVSIMQSVTLGGTGKEAGDRHPKVRKGVLIGAGAKILGNISVGECAKIGAGSVVLKDVPARATVAGVPAQIIGETQCNQPAREMDHLIR